VREREQRKTQEKKGRRIFLSESPKFSLKERKMGEGGKKWAALVTVTEGGSEGGTSPKIGGGRIFFSKLGDPEYDIDV